VAKGTLNDKQEIRNEGIETVYGYGWIVYWCQCVYVVICGDGG
jgi:hypothetical protein